MSGDSFNTLSIVGIVVAKRWPRVLRTLPMFLRAKTYSVVLKNTRGRLEVLKDLLVDVRVGDLDVAEGATAHIRLH